MNFQAPYSFARLWGFLIAFLFLSCSIAQAQVTWDGDAGDGLWSSPANWDTDVVPGDNDDVRIIGNFAVTVNASDSCRSITLQSQDANNLSASLTITSGAQLGVGNTIQLDDRSRNSNSATLIVEGGSRLVTGGNITLLKDGSNNTNNDMRMIIQGNNSRVDIGGDLILTFTSSNSGSNDMGLVMTESSVLNTTNITTTLSGNMDNNITYSLNLTGVAGDSAVINVANDFTSNLVGGSQDLRLEMAQKARVNVGNNFSFNASSGRDVRLVLDDDAVLNVTNDASFSKGGNNDFELFLNQNSDGTTTDAQFLVGGNCTINKFDADFLLLRLSNNADWIVGGNLTVTTTNADDNNDNFRILVENDASIDVDGIVDITMSDGDAIDLIIEILNNGEIVTTNNFNITMANADETFITVNGNGALNVGADFLYDNTSSANQFSLDMDSNAVMTVGQDMIIENRNGSNTTLALDRDASLTVGDSLHLVKTSNSNILVLLNTNADGSAADAQLTASSISVNKTDGDLVRFLQRNHSDINVTTDIVIATSNTDDNDDLVEFDLENDSRLVIGRNWTIGLVESNRDPDILVTLSEQSRATVGGAINFSASNAGDIFVTLSETASLLASQTWTNTLSGSSEFRLTMSDATDVDVTDDFTINSTSSSTVVFDLDNTATLDMVEDCMIVNSGSSGTHFLLDRDAAFTIADTLDVTHGGNGSVLVRLNNDADGAAADAQFNIGSYFHVDKNDGDQTEFILNDESDLNVGGQFFFETATTDDNADNLSITMSDNSRFIIGDSLKIEMIESNRNPDLVITLRGTAQLTSTRGAGLQQTNGGGCLITLSNSSLISIGEGWTHGNSGAQEFLTTMTDATSFTVNGDFNFNTSGSGSMLWDLDNTSAVSITGDLEVFNNAGGGTLFQLDRDATFSITDSLINTEENNGSFRIQLNNTSDGAGADAQFTIGGALVVDQNDGDEVDFDLRNQSDLIVSGKFSVSTSNRDDNNDDFTINLVNDAQMTLGDSLSVLMFETSRNPDFIMSLSNNARITSVLGWRIAANSGDIIQITTDDNSRIDIPEGLTIASRSATSSTFTAQGASDINITDGFTYTISGSSSTATLNVSETATVDVGQSLTMNNTGSGGGNAVRINGDGALTITNNLDITETSNGSVLIYLNEVTDGSAADAQLSVGGNLTINKSDGDKTEIRLSNDADLLISGNLSVTDSGTDDNNDDKVISLDNESRITVGGNMSFTLDESSRNPDLFISLSETAQFSITQSATISIPNGDRIVFSQFGTSLFSVGQDLTVTHGNAGAFTFDLTNASDFNIGRDFLYTGSSVAGNLNFFLDSTATFDIADDMELTHGGSGGGIRFQLNRDAAVTIIDNLDIVNNANGVITFHLNQTTDGSAADAQMNIGGRLMVDKNDGDEFQILLANSSDLIIGSDLNLDVTNSDDNNDDFSIVVANDGRLIVGDDFTINQIENTRNPDLLIDLFDNGLLQVTGNTAITVSNGDIVDFDIEDDGSWTTGQNWSFNNNASSVGMKLDMQENGVFTALGMAITTLGNGDTDLEIDGDASITVTNDLTISHTNNEDLFIYLNQDSDGSAADAQISVGRDFQITFDAADRVQIFMSQDADILVGNDLFWDFDDSDDNGDVWEITLNNNATIDVEGTATINNNNQFTSNTQFTLTFNNNSRFDVGPAGGPFTTDSLYINISGGDDVDLYLNNSAQMNVFGNIRFTKSAGDDWDFHINLNGGTDALLNVEGNLTMENTDSDNMRIHTEQVNSLIDVEGDIRFEANASNLVEIELNNGSNLNIAGNFVRTGGFGILDGNGTSTVTYDGTSSQIFAQDAGSGTDIFDYQNVQINNTSAGVPQLTMEGQAVVHDSLIFIDGVIQTTSVNLLIVDNGGSSNTSSNASHIFGPIRKVGLGAFTFPTGTGQLLRPIAISAPSSTTDAYQAEYFKTDPDPLFDRSSREVTLQGISSIEYWTLDMVVPSSAVAVTLTWDTASGVGDSSTVVVSRWNGSQWINHGNGGVSGNNSNGSVVSSGTIASFSPFTLGTTSIINNPLPIELLSFNASLQGDVVELTWTTATEINNDFFTIERSQDGNTWEEVGVVSGAGNSTSVRHY